MERLGSPVIGYDTVKIWTNTSDNDFRAFERIMSNDFDRVQRNGNGMHASCRNLRFSLFENGNSITVEGSLQKFFTGQNIDTTLPNDMRDAIGVISDTFNINFSIGGLSKVDVATTFEMNEPPENYYSMLWMLNGYNRDIVQGKPPTLQFSKGSDGNGWQYQKFYNKGIEAGIANYLLRTEYSVRGKLRQALKTGKRVEPAMLWDTDFYHYICIQMIKNMESIKIVNPVGWDALPEYPTQKDFARLAQIRCHQLEREIILEKINSTEFKTPREKARVKKWANELTASGMLCNDPAHIKRRDEYYSKIEALKFVYL